MKFFKKYVLQTILLIPIIGSTLISGCGGDDPKPGELESAKKDLTSGTWKVQEVTIDGVNHTGMYEDLTIDFSSASYTSSGGEPVWPTAGTWSFTDETVEHITRDDNVVVTILALSKNALSLELVWDDTTLGSGRAAALSGVHVFKFTK